MQELLITSPFDNNSLKGELAIFFVAPDNLKYDIIPTENAM